MDKIQSWLNQKGDNAATALVAVLEPLGVRVEALQAAIEADLQEIRLADWAERLEREGIDPSALVARVAQKAAAEAAQQEAK